MIYTFSLKEDIQSITIVPEMLQRLTDDLKFTALANFFEFLQNRVNEPPSPPSFPLNLSGRKLGFFVFLPLLHFLSICRIEIGKIMLRTAFRSLTSTSPLNKPVSDMLDVFFKYFSY